ncbi:tail fiber domain-containing protein [Streptococcus sp. SO4]|uniref:phage tail spike protein n=1 Tax=Streptococcus sp. SO4 TaxID=3018249 RepID=UPI00263F619E|nr:phage tail spike protein [Streptococcus sp. SO4]MDN5025121.1 tail fiber domain-containing protein [Streptococcus sp. SO4]
MIYLTNGNMPLNTAYADEIVQEDNSTYQLSFRFPTSDPLWEKLKEETFLMADDLHGEQDFVIFEVEKKHGYIQVYANQVFTLLNNYVVNPISLDRQTGSTALSRFAGSITRDNPFSFFSDIEDRHTFNVGSKNAMEAFAKDKHSIIGQWGGDLVRHGYQVRLLKNGGSENESLFMYKKNLSSYQHKTSTKSLKTRITFTTTVKGEGEKAPDRTFTVTIDSPLINKYSQIYEDVIEVNDQDVKDEASLREYGKQYFRTTLCDMMEDSLELEVVGQSDVPVQMFDIVSLFHDVYNLDVRKKITKYTYSPMAKKLKSIGFGQFQSGLANAIGNAVSDAVKGEAQQFQGNFERQLARELKNADLSFDRRKEELVNQFTDDVNAIKAKAEETKQEIINYTDQTISQFSESISNSVQVLTDQALEKAGASNLLAQEAKRIGLDSIAKLEEFKRQATSAQTALSGDLDVLKRTIANDIRPKQEQVTAEIAKQVEALTQTKKELAGVKTAQATYEETTTQRLAELTNLANGKASKSELTQTAEQLASKLASVQASGRNLFLNSLFKQDISKTGIWTTSTYTATIDSENKYLGHNALKIIGQNPAGRDGGNPKITYPAFWQFGKVIPGSTTNQDVTISFYAKASKNGIMLRSRLGNINYKTGNVILSTEIKRYVVHIPKSWTNESKFSTNEWLFNLNQEGTVWIWMPKFEISDVDTSYSEAPEDIEGQISAVESNFRQRADSLDAGVNRLTEGLRTKADISVLNVTAENIRQSVKSLEASTQNKLNQMLSLAEFEVRAGSIRQEILNATKDKADKTLVTAEAGKLREEFSNLRVGGTNLLKGSKGPFLPDRKPANFDNAILYAGNTSIYMEQGQEYIISAKTDGNFTAHHDGLKESDNVVLWIMDKDVRNYQIVSDLKTGTTGTKITWNKPTGIYHLRVNTYHKEATKSVWAVKIEKGNVATDWSPAIEDTDGLITEAKATFERTAQGLRTDLSAIQEYVNQDGQRQEVLQRYAREESAKQATSVRELVARDYVGKATHQEDVRGLERKFESITNPKNGLIATQIANYKQSVDGRFADISSLLSGKASQADFQRVKETSQLYERILGSTDNGIADNVARMAVTNQLFQVEVAKASASGRNLFLSSTATKGYLGRAGVINVANSTQKEITSDFISVEPNEKIIFQHWVTLPENGMAFTAWQFFDKNKEAIDARVTGSNAYKTATGKQHNINQIIVPANAYFIRVSARMYNDGLIKIERGSAPSDYSVAPEDTDEAIRTVQSQLAGSWAVQNLTSAGAIVSQINAANNQILIEAEKIRLKGKTLLDELTAIQGYFKRLFVGEGTFATLNADVIRTNSITADKLVMDMAMARRFVSSDLFTDTLAAKEAFINKLRSVVVTATLLEGFRGRIGGFQIGTHDNDPSSFWLTGLDQFKVGMSNGRGREFQTAFWANWGNTWGKSGPLSWYVTLDGQMYCNNNATFHRVVDFSSTCSVNFYGANSFYKDIYMRNGSEIYGTGSTPRAGGKNSVVWWNQVGDGSLKYHIDMASDKRLKENIVDSNIVALDKIKQLKMKSFDFISTGKHEEVGLIAQEVEAILPSVISKNPEKADDYLHIDYVAIVPYLIKSIQELNQKIEEMEKTVA